MARGLVLMVLLVATARIAYATVELPVDFDELVAGSQVVVHGRVTDVRGQQVDNRRSIETVITIAVTEAFKGQPGATVSFRMPGGEVGRYRRVMVGVPRFTEGDEVVVFLRGAAPALPTVFGLSQGLFRIARTTDGRAIVTPPPLVASGVGAERVVRGDPARRPLAIEAFAREVRARAESRP
jgi:hypothetical protein